MAFHVPASKKSRGQNMFAFEIGTKTYKVKRAKFTSIGELEALEQGSGALEFFGAKGTAQGDAIRGLDGDQFRALVEAWRDDSEVSLGESPASDS